MPGNWNSGRRPVPGPLRALRGLDPNKRRILTRINPEPTLPAPDNDFDHPPKELVGLPEAEAEWRRIVPILREAQLVTIAERSILIAVCLHWSRYLEAEQKIRTGGLTANGKKSVYVAISSDSLSHCHRLWTELGLTALARTRIQPAMPKAAHPPVSKWANDL